MDNQDLVVLVLHPASQDLVQVLVSQDTPVYLDLVESVRQASRDSAQALVSPVIHLLLRALQVSPVILDSQELVHQASRVIHLLLQDLPASQDIPASQESVHQASPASVHHLVSPVTPDSPVLAHQDSLDIQDRRDLVEKTEHQLR